MGREQDFMRMERVRRASKSILYTTGARAKAFCIQACKIIVGEIPLLARTRPTCPTMQPLVKVRATIWYLTFLYTMQMHELSIGIGL